MRTTNTALTVALPAIAERAFVLPPAAQLAAGLVA